MDSILRGAKAKKVLDLQIKPKDKLRCYIVYTKDLCGLLTDTASVKQIAPHPKYVVDVFTQILPLKICSSSPGEHAVISGSLVFQALPVWALQRERRHNHGHKSLLLPRQPCCYASLWHFYSFTLLRVIVLGSFSAFWPLKNKIDLRRYMKIWNDCNEANFTQQL